MNSHRSMRIPEYFEHVLLLDGEDLRIAVDLNWIGSIDFSEAFCNLFAIEFESESTATQFQSLAAKLEEHTRFVGKVIKDGTIEVFIYSSLEDVLSDVDVLPFSSYILDCFVTKDDCGRFYRSFLLPTAFRDLSVSYVTMVTEFGLTGRSCTMIVLSTLIRKSTNSDFIDQLTSTSSWIAVDKGINGIVFKSEVKSLDMASQHRDLVQLFKLSIELGCTLCGVEFDLR
jgi:hypothetical protein